VTGAITYVYSALADGVRQMQAVNQNIEQNVSTLVKQVQGLREAFDGQTAKSYDESANRIFKTLTESNQVLNEMSVSLNRNSNNMQSTDQATAGTFHS
jgi:WXG100 family type VII secretion target